MPECLRALVDHDYKNRAAGSYWNGFFRFRLVYYLQQRGQSHEAGRKNRKSRERILKYAFGEFAEKGYLGASVNSICAAGNISKGLLYHYYADKDTLYLRCVELCFQELTAALSAVLNAQTVTPDQYFEARLVFFVRHPNHQRLFCDTVVNPPVICSGSWQIAGPPLTR